MMKRLECQAEEFAAWKGTGSFARSHYGSKRKEAKKGGTKQIVEGGHKYERCCCGGKTPKKLRGQKRSQHASGSKNSDHAVVKKVGISSP